MSKILDIHIRKIAWSSHSCRPVDQAVSFFYLGARLLLVIIQAEKPIQLQPMAGYRLTRNLLPSLSQSRREKTTTNGRYSWQYMYFNAILIVLCISNGLICTCAYITGIHDKRIVTLCTMWHLPQTIGVFWLLFSILFTNYLAIIYGADNI